MSDIELAEALSALDRIDRADSPFSYSYGSTAKPPVQIADETIDLLQQMRRDNEAALDVVEYAIRAHRLWVNGHTDVERWPEGARNFHLEATK